MRDDWRDEGRDGEMDRGRRGEESMTTSRQQRSGSGDMKNVLKAYISSR